MLCSISCRDGLFEISLFYAVSYGSLKLLSGFCNSDILSFFIVCTFRFTPAGLFRDFTSIIIVVMNSVQYPVSIALMIQHLLQPCRVKG